MTSASPPDARFHSTVTRVPRRAYRVEEKHSLDDFKDCISRTTASDLYQLASSIDRNIPIYDSRSFETSDLSLVDRWQDEMYHVLTDGPGIFVIKRFFQDNKVVEAANVAYSDIIAQEATESGAKGDHFAAGGSNSRIWNSFSKHGQRDPTSFYAYFANPLFKIVSEAYLGPAYRITTQANIVRPGGKPQTSHRDYHLGFQTGELASKWPKSIHHTSALLTLQGAIAHSDQPVASGTTRVLPYSHQYAPGYMAYHDPEFDEYFTKSYVSLPFQKGDAVFFNPALFHAAGQNDTTDVHRSNNLIQISSAFGKPMEAVKAAPLIERCWDLLRREYKHHGMNTALDAFVCAVGEGYPFPTNLDERPPAPNGMAPESEQDILRKGLVEDWSRERVLSELEHLQQASQP